MNMCNMEQEIKTSPVAETWRPVKGFEGLYEVSDHARVRSLDRWVTQDNNGTLCERIYKGKIISQQIDHNGYLSVHISINGKVTGKNVHRLVAEAFVPNPNNLPCINHKDENKRNNLPSNLEWCDYLYNNNYGTRKKRVLLSRGKPIEQLTLDGQHVAFYKNNIEAELKSGGKYKSSNIRAAITKRKRKTAYGYQWRYI